MATEDFSFPIVSDAFPRFIDSPPLWHASSATLCHEGPTTSNTSGQQEDDEEGGCFASTSKPVDHPRRKSFSCVETGGRMAGGGDEIEDDEEDRMDMLWEDFNEELHNRCGPRSGSEEMVKVGCVQGVAAPRIGGAVVAARRAASLLVLVKMLRKLFQLHNSHSTRKAHAL
ncbi:hypothetical protein AAG906_000894 [Vitis piasezkii]